MKKNRQFLSDESPKKNSILPNIVEKYINSAAEVSMYNEIPAALSFFVLLGQLCKDMVAIPFGRRVDDPRIQQIWMPTSGSGKSEMYNFFGPVAKMTFEMVNATYAHAPINVNDVDVKYDIFDALQSDNSRLRSVLPGKESDVETLDD